MNDRHEKIVDFAFCRLCEHRYKKESEDPCDECLDNPMNIESHRPIHFKDAGFTKKRREKNG